jgi:hypothetical protein
MEEKVTSTRRVVKKPTKKSVRRTGVRIVKSQPATKAYVKKLLDQRIEPKYTQSSTGILSVYASNTTAGSVWQDITSGISQGAGDFGNRIGDQINLLNLNLNYTCFCPAGATAAPSNCIRVCVVQYMRDDGTPVSTQMLRTTSILGGPYYSSYSLRNRDYLKFYKIIYDERHIVISQTAAATSVSSAYRHDIKVSIPLKGKVVHYTAGSTTSVNGIWVFAIADQPTVAGNPNVAMNWQLLYQDA